MMQASQDGNLRDEVVLEFLVQLVHVDRLDGYVLSFFLSHNVSILHPKSHEMRN